MFMAFDDAVPETVHRDTARSVDETLSGANTRTGATCDRRTGQEYSMPPGAIPELRRGNRLLEDSEAHGTGRNPYGVGFSGV